MKIYRIQDKITGLYSTGGMNPEWSTKGKMWNGIGPCKNHIVQFANDNRFLIKVSDFYKDAVMVEYRMEETVIYEQKVIDILKESIERKNEKAIRYNSEWQKQRYIEAKAIVEMYERKAKALD